MSDYIELERRFVQRSDYSPEELLSAGYAGPRLSWHEVLANRYAIIVAPANYGKTTELVQQVAQRRKNGDHALFVKLREVSAAESLASALDEGDSKALDTWRASNGERLTLLVDSLDEASLGSEQSLALGLKRLGEWIGWPRPNIFWVISTRPAILTPPVMETLSKFLRTSFLTVSAEDGMEPGASEGASPRSSTMQAFNAEGVSDPLVIFSMLALTRPQASEYLAKKKGVANPKVLLKCAVRHGLRGLTDNPGALDVLTYIRLLEDPPQSLSSAYARVVDTMVELHRDKRTRLVGNPGSPQLLSATETLAAASILCQLVNIDLPQEVLTETRGRLSARVVVSTTGSDLSDETLRYLLGSHLFIDAGHEQVKLYPDELKPYLAARRIDPLIKSPELAERLLEILAFQASTGESGVYRHHLPVAGWLATMNVHCRESLMRRDPQAVAFFGDLRSSSVDSSAAARALCVAMKRIAIDDDILGRRYYGLTTDNYWQAGRSSNAHVVLDLFRKYSKNRAVRSALLSIAINSRLEELRPAILEAHKSNYSSILRLHKDAWYLAELGYPEDLAGLTQALLARDTDPEGIALLLPYVAWKTLASNELATLIADHVLQGPGAHRIAFAVTSEVIEEASPENLGELIDLLFQRLSDYHRRQSETPSRLQSEEKMLELIAELIAVEVTADTPLNPERLAAQCTQLLPFIEEGLHGFFRSVELRAALEKSATVRQQFLSAMIDRASKRNEKLDWTLMRVEGIYQLTREDAHAVKSDELLGLVERFEHPPKRADPQSDRTSARARQAKRRPIDEASKKALHHEIEGIRAGTASSALGWIAQWLLRRISNTRYGEADLSSLEEELGPELATAIAQGLRKTWRLKPPAFEEGNPNSTYHMTIAGLQGLHVELGDGSALPALTDQEIYRALDYASFEINGFPKWFAPLVAAHPALAGEHLVRMMDKSTAGAVSKARAENLLSSLQSLPVAVQQALFPTAFNYLTTATIDRPDVVSAVLQCFPICEGAISQSAFEAAARRQVLGKVHRTDEKVESVDGTSAKAANTFAEDWGLHWLLNFPSTFIEFIEAWKARKPKVARSFIFALAAHLGERNTDRLTQLARRGSEGIRGVSMLYQWVAETVKRKDDRKRISMEIYSLDRRDRAEGLRDSLLGLIASIDTDAAYAGLSRIRRRSTDPLTRTYIRWAQFDMQERRYARPALLARQYAEFEREISPPISTYAAFAMSVHSDLLAVKYQIERGEFSPRRFFSLRKHRRTPSRSTCLALEQDFQVLLGRELEHASLGRYSVAREDELPEGTRRDLVVQHQSFRASIELKMSVRWSVKDYLFALEHQLLGQYLRSRGSRVGFLVVMLQTANRRWKRPGSEKRIDFDVLLNILRRKAALLQEKDSELRLYVVGIDATDPRRESAE